MFRSSLCTALPSRCGRVHAGTRFTRNRRPRAVQLAYATTAAPQSKFNDLFLGITILESVSYAVGYNASILLRGELALVLRWGASDGRQCTRVHLD
jgi:hypothetical protein